MFFVRNDMPFNVAFSSEPDESRAWVVVLGEPDGHARDRSRAIQFCRSGLGVSGGGVT